jgi:hypothetical protein
MTLLAELAGESSLWIGWEVSYGLPVIILVAFVAISIATGRALRGKKRRWETGNAPETSTGKLGLEELPAEQGEELFQSGEHACSQDDGDCSFISSHCSILYMTSRAFEPL